MGGWLTLLLAESLRGTGRVAGVLLIAPAWDMTRTLMLGRMTKKARAALERDGYIQTVRGQGTFLTDEKRALTAAARLERLRPIAQRLLHEATLLNVELKQVQRLIDEESGRLDRVRGSSNAAAERRSK